MELIHQTLRLAEAQTPNEIDDATNGAHEAVERLRVAKLQELQDAVDRRLGGRMTMNPAMAPTPTEGRKIRDNPQA